MSTSWASPSIGVTSKAALQASQGAIADCFSPFTPAGKMEAFFNQRYPASGKPVGYSHTAEDVEMMHAFGMELKDHR
jgi:hypothetical protein